MALRETPHAVQVVAVLRDQTVDDAVGQGRDEMQIGPGRGEGRRRVVAQVVRTVQAITRAIRSTAQSTSSRVITRGGAKRITWSWVSFARMPSSISFSQ